jgi:hypothetical protein
MSNILRRLYEIKIEEKNLDEKIQMSIARYIVANNDLSLNHKFLRLKNLNTSAEEYLLNKGSSEILWQWGKCQHEYKHIFKFLVNISDPKKLAELASVPFFPVSVYAVLYSKNKSKALLENLISNEKVSPKIKIEALLTYADKFPLDFADLRTSKMLYREAFVIAKDEKSSFYQELLRNPDTFPILAQYVLDVTYSEVERKIIFDKYERHLEKLSLQVSSISNKRERDLLILATCVVEDFNNYILENHTLIEGERELIKSKSEKLSIYLTAFPDRDVVNAGKSLLRSTSELRSSERDLLNEKINNAKTEQELTVIFNEMKNLNSNFKLTNRAFDSLAHQITLNPICEDILRHRALESMSWSVGEVLNKYLTNPVILGQALAYANIDNPIKLIESSIEPKKAFDEYVRCYVNRHGYLPTEIYESPYFKLEHLVNFSTEFLAYSALAPKAEEMLSKYISEELTESLHWEHFESLSGKFDGTIRELVEVSKNV